MQIILEENSTTKQLIVGVMSGTSLDGLDLALCEFEIINNKYVYTLVKAQTIHYSTVWKQYLTDVKTATALHYFKLNSEYGEFIAEQITLFLKDIEQSINAIASHGHTVFHQPQLGFSTQIGCGATIAAKTGTTVICDFRSLDVALGGQGAPLVPIGDELLFNDYEACLNLGGIANISFKNNKGLRVAYDICETNMLLNYLAQKMGYDYDENGNFAMAGKIDEHLLIALNDLPFYQQTGAKSLGREWFEETILPFFTENKNDVKNLLATSVEHIAQVIANNLNKNNIKNVFITGGGAFNSHLINTLTQKTSCKLIIPNAQIINFKEALIFAFLGYLRLQQKTNTLSLVTGATKNSIGGVVYLM